MFLFPDISYLFFLDYEIRKSIVLCHYCQIKSFVTVSWKYNFPLFNMECVLYTHTLYNIIYISCLCDLCTLLYVTYVSNNLSRYFMINLFFIFYVDLHINKFNDRLSNIFFK